VVAGHEGRQHQGGVTIRPGVNIHKGSICERWSIDDRWVKTHPPFPAQSFMGTVPLQSHRDCCYLWLLVESSLIGLRNDQISHTA
jgi:hypothetical protein